MSRMFLLVAASGLFSCAAQATVVITSPPFPSVPADLTARARWGAGNFEAQLLSGGVVVPGSDLNPAGNPVWQLGQPHNFRLTWDSVAGAIAWSLDFNRNGSFGAGETTSFTKPGRENISFQYLSLSLTSRQVGANSNALDIGNFTVNGVNFGSFSAAGGAALTQWFAPTANSFVNLDITGTITFRNTGGNGAFQNERPNLNIAFAGLQPVPEPASWAMLIAGFGLTGAMLRRRRAFAASAPSAG